MTEETGTPLTNKYVIGYVANSLYENVDGSVDELRQLAEETVCEGVEVVVLAMTDSMAAKAYPGVGGYPRFAMIDYTSRMEAGTLPTNSQFSRDLQTTRIHGSVLNLKDRLNAKDLKCCFWKIEALPLDDIVARRQLEESLQDV